MSGLDGVLVALDVDGTLLRSDGSLAARTVDALDAARRGGAVLTLATGRDWSAAAPLLGQLPAIDYALCVNGIEVFRADGHELHATDLDPDLARAAIVALRDAIPGVVLGIGLAGDLVAEAGVNETLPPGNVGAEVVADVLEVVTDGVRDLVVYHPELSHDLDAFHARCVAALPFDGLDVVFSGLPMIEVVPPGSGKHHGLAWLADHLGIARADVVAVGDGRNDLSMLRWAGLGVAMGHAPPEVLGAADVVIGTNDADGLAAWIEHRLGS